MEIQEPTVESILKKVHYYSFIPKQIKFSAFDLEIAINNLYSSNLTDTIFGTANSRELLF